VAKDNTISFEGTMLQIPKTSPFRSYANPSFPTGRVIDLKNK
jgi:hypothetical protein